MTNVDSCGQQRPRIRRRLGASSLSISLVLSICALSQTASAFHPLHSSSISCQSKHKTHPNSPAVLFAGGSGADTDRPATGKGTARLSGPKDTGATGIVDSVLTLLSSDGASIALGLLGITICLFNRLSHIDDYDALTAVADGADALGRQSRADLLAVFASGAILLNGISKLDVTSALAESVVLDGVQLDGTAIYWEALEGVGLILDQNDNDSVQTEITWALESVLDATPAKTAVIMAFDTSSGSWTPVAASGTVPADESLQRALPQGRTTPILDRFQGGGMTKESYLPTLQALPGRVEFTYLPPNTQEALVLPMSSSSVLVLGSDTAKSCTPRDVAWAQVIASRLGQLFS